MFNTLVLNGITYKPDELLRLAHEVTEPDYLGAIFRFAAEWVDGNEEVIVHSSGSTGKPTSIKLKKAHMVNSALMTARFFGLSKGDTALLCLPASFIAGKMMIVRAFISGFNLIAFPPTTNPLAETGSLLFSFTALTPPQLVSAMPFLATGMVKHTIVGGAALPSGVADRVRLLPQAVWQTYGMTETCSHVALRRLNGTDTSPEYKALPGISFTVDNRGCLIIKAPHLLNDLLVTNDIVELTDPVTFIWTDRADRVINSGSIKLFPRQIEEAIENMIDVPFFVSAIPDKDYGERPILVIEQATISQGEKEALLGKIRNVLPRYHCPANILAVLPFVYSPTGKLLRHVTLEKASKDGNKL